MAWLSRAGDYGVRLLVDHRRPSRGATVATADISKRRAPPSRSS